MPAITPDRCVDYVLDRLRRGQLKTSDRLSIERVAGETGAGHASVRAAFERLETIGVVERRPRSGTYVRRIELTEYVQALDVRAALEDMACQLAAKRLTESQLDRLAGQAERLDQHDYPGADLSRYVRLDAAFHLSIARASGNRMLLRSLERPHLVSHFLAAASQLPEMALVWYLPQRVTHRDVVEALRGKSGDEAGRLMRQHILQQVQVIKKQYPRLTS